MVTPDLPPGHLPPIDARPDARGPALDWAREILADVTFHPDATLRHACTIILTLSPDHTERNRATEINTILKD